MCSLAPKPSFVRCETDKPARPHALDAAEIVVVHRRAIAGFVRPLRRQDCNGVLARRLARDVRPGTAQGIGGLRSVEACPHRRHDRGRLRRSLVSAALSSASNAGDAACGRGSAFSCSWRQAEADVRNRGGHCWACSTASFGPGRGPSQTRAQALSSLDFNIVKSSSKSNNSDSRPRLPIRLIA